MSAVPWDATVPVRSTRPPRPGSAPRGDGGRTAAFVAVVLVALVLVAFGTAVLLGEGSGPRPDPAHSAAADSALPDPAVPALPGSSVPGNPVEVAPGDVPVPPVPTGAATLSAPTITTSKAPYRTAQQWCSLLTADDIHQLTSFEQRGAPESTLMCTRYTAGNAGYVLVSDIPAAQGVAYWIRGNSALVYQSSPTSCEVSVALNHGGGVLDIDVRGLVRPRMLVCDAAAGLAVRAFDRLPDR
ncbi:MAG TPA: hypothetical protein VGJ13_00210 [Pseudonocardiaceae bacterium]